MNKIKNYFKDLRTKTGNMPLIMMGAAGAIIKENKILLVMHKQKKLWQIPGGVQELGESIEETIIREINEELGLNLEVDYLLALLTSPKWKITYSDDFFIHSNTAFFKLNGDFKERDIILQHEELMEYRFFEFNNIPDNIFPCCKHKVELVKNWNGTVFYD